MVFAAICRYAAIGALETHMSWWEAAFVAWLFGFWIGGGEGHSGTLVSGVRTICFSIHVCSASPHIIRWGVGHVMEQIIRFKKDVAGGIARGIAAFRIARLGGFLSLGG